MKSESRPRGFSSSLLYSITAQIRDENKVGRDVLALVVRDRSAVLDSGRPNGITSSHSACEAGNEAVQEDLRRGIAAIQCLAYALDIAAREASSWWDFPHGLLHCASAGRPSSRRGRPHSAKRRPVQFMTMPVRWAASIFAMRCSCLQTRAKDYNWQRAGNGWFDDQGRGANRCRPASGTCGGKAAAGQPCPCSLASLGPQHASLVDMHREPPSGSAGLINEACPVDGVQFLVSTFGLVKLEVFTLQLCSCLPVQSSLMLAFAACSNLKALRISIFETERKTNRVASSMPRSGRGQSPAQRTDIDFLLFQVCSSFWARTQASVDVINKHPRSSSSSVSVGEKGEHQRTPESLALHWNRLILGPDHREQKPARRLCPH